MAVSKSFRIIGVSPIELVLYNDQRDEEARVCVEAAQVMFSGTTCATSRNSLTRECSGLYNAYSRDGHITFEC